MRLRYQILLFALFYSLFFLIAINITVPRFGTNDDLFFNDLLSGRFTGEPYLFTNMTQSSPRKLFSLPVWLLFHIYNFINWYFVVLAGILILSLAITTAILSSIAGREIKILIRFLTILISFFSIYWWAATPTYTAAAFFPSVAAGIILILMGKEFKINKMATSISAALLIGASMSIRFESAIIPLAVLVLPVIGRALYFHRRDILKPLALFLLIISSIHLINEIAQKSMLSSTKNWQSYNEFESMRYTIHENQFQRLLEIYPNEFGWSENKVKAFLTYNFADKIIYSNSDLVQLNSKLSNFDHGQTIRWEDLERRIEARVGPFKDLWIFTFFLSIFAMLISRNKSVLVLVLLSNLLFASISVFILVNLRSPERIVVPALVTLLFSVLAALASGKSKEAVTKINLISFNILPIVFSLFFLSSLFMFQYQRSVTTIYLDFAQQQAKDLVNLSDNALFIGNASQFRWDWTNPYIYTPPPYEYLATGIYTFSPPWNQRTRNYGLDENQLYLSGESERDLYFVSNEETSQSLRLVFLEELNKELELNLILEKSFDFGSYNVYKVGGGSSVG